MTQEQAIESLINSCKKYAEIVEQLQKENAFLADTIEKNNLNQIKTERQSLLKENEKCKNDLRNAISEINQAKSEYAFKISELNNKLAEIKRKQDDIELYINAEADKKVKNIKLEYQNYKKANKENFNKNLAENIAKNNDILQREKLKLHIQNRMLIIITIISMIFGTISIFIHF